MTGTIFFLFGLHFYAIIVQFDYFHIFLDASVVRAEGPGLKDAISGQKAHFFITTLDAGSGVCI